MKLDPQVDQYILNAGGVHAEILTRLRALIFRVVPKAVESFKWSRPVYGLGKDFCYLQKNKNYVSLGFMNLTKIEDPEQLLEGTGKTMRHLKFSSPEEIDEAYLSVMIEQSVL
jgi:hypothetical protein